MSDLALIAALNKNQRAKAIRDQQGAVRCSACRNQVHHRASKCEHCGCSLYTRRGKYGAALFGGIGGALLMLSLFALLFVPFAFEQGFVGGIIALQIAGLIVVACIASLYVARDLKHSQPVWELRVRDRLPF